jgi:hypothetical protein
MKAFVTFIALAGMTIAATLADTALAPSTLLASPTSYMKHPITVRGTVSNVHVRGTRHTLMNYQLCDATSCVDVVQLGGVLPVQGEAQSVTGRMHRLVVMGQIHVRNAIVIPSHGL